MPTSIDKYIFDYDKRTRMRQNPLFKRLSIEVDDKKYLTPEAIGYISYIIRDCLEKLKKENSTLEMSIYEWEKYYLESGKRRIEIIQKNRGRVTYQHNEYYGRNLDDISKIAQQFYNDYKTQYKFNPQAALNIIYIKVIDESYDEYLRLINTIRNLKNNNPGFIFEISDPLTNKEQAIDTFVYNKDKDLVGAIKILPEYYYGFEIDGSREEEKEILRQQHEIFEMTYDIIPDFVYAESSGRIQGNIPKYL